MSNLSDPLPVEPDPASRPSRRGGRRPAALGHGLEEENSDRFEVESQRRRARVPAAWAR
ncbi:MAG: hypothetical protein WKG07_19400 [Hymenobacter sp.]